MDREAWQATVYGVTNESDTNESLSLSHSLSLSLSHTHTHTLHPMLKFFTG